MYACGTLKRIDARLLNGPAEEQSVLRRYDRWKAIENDQVACPEKHDCQTLDHVLPHRLRGRRTLYGMFAVGFVWKISGISCFMPLFLRIVGQ